MGLLNNTAIVFVFFISGTFAITFDEIGQLYGKREFAKVIHITDSLMSAGNDSSWVKAFAGRAYVDLMRFDEAVALLQSVYESPQNTPEWMRAWNTLYLGKAHLYSGNFAKAETLFNQVIESRATKNVIAMAQRYLHYTPRSQFYKDWEKIQTRNFNFLFHKRTKVRNTREFARIMQQSFDTINAFFNAEIPGKINFFVWNKYIKFPHTPKYPGGFAVPELRIVHTRYMQTPGHEMTHVITHYAVDSVSCVTAFINEGIATLFDLSGRNWLEQTRNYLSGKKLSIQGLWQSNQAFRKLPQNLSYSLAAAFAQRLIKEGGKEKYFKLLADQSWNSAQKIYKNALTEIIEDFWNKL